MALVLRSLSDFKRFLAKPGATIQILRNTFIERQPASFQEAYRQKGMYEPRTVQAISKKAAVFAIKGHPSTVWLYWDKGTRNWRYSGDTLAVPLNTGVGPPDEIIYRCSFSPGSEPKARASRSSPRQIQRSRRRRRRRISRSRPCPSADRAACSDPLAVPLAPSTIPDRPARIAQSAPCLRPTSIAEATSLSGHRKSIRWSIRRISDAR